MDVKLLVDQKEIEISEFVKQILSGVITGAVLSLRNIDKDWQRMRIEIIRS